MFRVRWTRIARNELAEIWLNANSALRKEITAAAHRIEQSLRHAPESKGESREDATRVYFDAPLGILFVVDNEHSTVRIARVWTYGKRG